MATVQLGLNTTDIDTAVEDARAAERAGFDYLGCGEHLFFHGPVPNAFVTLAAAAGATSTIRLVSAITLLPIYPARRWPRSWPPRSTACREAGSSWGSVRVGSTWPSSRRSVSIREPGSVEWTRRWR
jgi:hypothetical protein